MQEQIDATVDSAVERARSRLEGESRTHCEDCERPIPERRRKLLSGVRRCVACQREHDEAELQEQLFNRRGSKDSQLK